MRRNAVMTLAKTYRGYTPALAFRCEKPALATLCKELGDDKMASVLSLHLISLSRFLNLKSGLTEEHIDYVVDKILHDETYRWFKMADVAIIIDRIKSGHYGNFYENFTATKLMEILAKYDAERTQAIEQVRINENEAYKGADKSMSAEMVEEYFSLEKKRVKDERNHQEEAKRNVDAARSQVKSVTDRANEILKETGCSLDDAYNQAMLEGLNARIS